VIQHIKNSFTVKVLESNARICLEQGDLSQYLQCCANLYDLYKDGVEGCKAEFLCYKIIYHALGHDDSKLIGILSELSVSDLESKEVKFAIE
jgi:hypothetical protein